MRTLQQNTNGNWARGCMVAFSVVWTSIVCCSMAAMAISVMNADDFTTAIVPTGFSFLFSLPFLAVGIGMFVWGIMPFVARTRVHKPEVGISANMLRVGEPFTVTYQQTFKAATEVESIKLQLVFREKATYRRGTDTYTVTHDRVVDQFEQGMRHFEAGDTFRESRRFEIPSDAMHSFAARNNSLIWIISIQVSIARWPDYAEEFPFSVLPEKALGV